METKTYLQWTMLQESPCSYTRLVPPVDRRQVRDALVVDELGVLYEPFVVYRLSRSVSRVVEIALRRIDECIGVGGW